MIRKNSDGSITSDAVTVKDLLDEIKQQSYAVHTSVTGFTSQIKETLMRDGKEITNKYNDRKVIRSNYRYGATFMSMTIYVKMEE